jgi:hypothetical protein
MNWTPTGIPVLPVAPGALRLGMPSSVHTLAKRGSPVEASPYGASPITAGVSRTSCPANSSPQSARAARHWARMASTWSGSTDRPKSRNSRSSGDSPEDDPGQRATAARVFVARFPAGPVGVEAGPRPHRRLGAFDDR